MYTASFPLAPTVEALRNDQLSLVQHIHTVCDRIDTAEPYLHVFVPEPHRRERLVEEAIDLLERFTEPAERPPLFGALVGVKDIFRVDGFFTRAGSDLPPELFEGPEATAVTRLKEAGALIAGKTVTTEFAYFRPGPTRNPHNLAHTPGGSSSGSAAGVAAGFFPLALGTQTIGSVIRPAAFCGVIGFKPSYDRIPTDGLLYFSKSLDHVGLFTQDLDGMALAASILCDGWDVAAARPAATPPVLAVPEGEYLERASAEGRYAFDEQLSRLEKAGVRIIWTRFFEDFYELDEEHRRLMAAEAAEVHRAWYARYDYLYSEHMHEIMALAQGVSEAEVARARANQLQLRQAIQEKLAEVGADLWVAPPARGPAPEGIESTGNPIMNLPWTNAGVPALTLPVDTTYTGLPLGLQLAAPFGQDEALLGWAYQIAALLRAS